MFERFLKSLTIVLILFIGNVVPNKLVQAQELNITVEPSAILADAEILSLTELGVNTDGSGPVLVSVIIENLSDQKAENLFLEIVVSSGKEGTILEYTQDSDRPFSLRPFQSVYITNNDVANEIFPGIEESIGFDGGLTPQGEDLIGELSGSTSLPQDVYSLEVTIFTFSDARGRQNLATGIAEIGGSSTGAKAVIEDSEIIPRTPGDAIGSESMITNPYPQFSWEGSTNISYRLIVVEDNGQDSPESLLQSAKSSSPLSEGGSLLEFENLDSFVEGTSFQYPSSGVQPLERGKTYYWQVSALKQSSSDRSEVLSEAWSFTLNDPTDQSSSGSPNENVTISEEVRTALIELIGQESFEQIQERGFTLESIEYDGQQFTGPAAALKLEELLQKIRDEKIVIQGN